MPLLSGIILSATTTTAATQHGAYMQYAASQDRARVPAHTLNGLTGTRVKQAMWSKVTTNGVKGENLERLSLAL